MSDTDSEFYAESSYVITPATSVSSSVEFLSSGNATPERAGSRNSAFGDDSESSIPPPAPSPPRQLGINTRMMRVPMSPNFQRTQKESREGILTSPKDTMLMQRKRLKGKGRGTVPVSSSFFEEEEEI